MIVLRKYAPMLDWFQARTKLSQCHTSGSDHGLWKISASDLNELTNDHSIGTQTMIAQQISTTLGRRADAAPGRPGSAGRACSGRLTGAGGATRSRVPVRLIRPPSW